MCVQPPSLCIVVILSTPSLSCSNSVHIFIYFMLVTAITPSPPARDRFSLTHSHQPSRCPLAMVLTSLPLFTPTLIESKSRPCIYIYERKGKGRVGQGGGASIKRCHVSHRGGDFGFRWRHGFGVDAAAGHLRLDWLRGCTLNRLVRCCNMLVSVGIKSEKFLA